MDSKANGYRKGQPDLELKCKDGDRADKITIDLQNPNGSNRLSVHQDEYIELLDTIEVENIYNSCDVPKYSIDELIDELDI